MATIHQTIDIAHRRAIVTGSDILSRHVANGSQLYYEIHDYEHGHQDDPALHASIARSVIRIALGTAAKLALTPPPATMTNDTIFYVDGQRLCDLKDVQFKLIQMTVDGKTVVIPTTTHYIIVTNGKDGRKISKTEIKFHE